MEVRLHPLLFSPSCSSSGGDDTHTNLRYIRSLWLNPSILVLLTRSPYLDPDVLLGHGKGDAMPSSSEVIVAQTWRVNDCQMKRKDLSSSKEVVVVSDAILISELKRPLGDEDLMRERSHSIFMVDSPSCVDDNEDDGLPDEQLSCFVADCESSMSISYHCETDCLMLCTQSVLLDSTSVR